MASIQCHKTCEDKSHHGHAHAHAHGHGGHGHGHGHGLGSYGQKLTGLFKGNPNHSNEGTKTHTQYHKQTEVFSQSGHVVAKSECNQTRTNTHGRSIKKRNLFEKIKDGVSGHSSDDNSCSDSESGSDSDNQNSRRFRKNCN